MVLSPEHVANRLPEKAHQLISSKWSFNVQIRDVIWAGGPARLTERELEDNIRVGVNLNQTVFTPEIDVFFLSVEAIYFFYILFLISSQRSTPVVSLRLPQVQKSTSWFISSLLKAH